MKKTRELRVKLPAELLAAAETVLKERKIERGKGIESLLQFFVDSGKEPQSVMLGQVSSETAEVWARFATVLNNSVKPTSGGRVRVFEQTAGSREPKPQEEL